MNAAAFRWFVTLSAACILWAWAGGAWAIGVVNMLPGGTAQQYMYRASISSFNSGPGYTHGSPAAAAAAVISNWCTAQPAAATCTYGWRFTATGTQQPPATQGCQTGGICTAQIMACANAACTAGNTGNIQSNLETVSTPGTCPGNATEVGTPAQCVCNLGYRNTTSDGQTQGFDQCSAYTCPTGSVGEFTFGPYPSKPGMDTRLTCDTDGLARGCSFETKPTLTAQSADGWYQIGSQTATGSHCQGTSADNGYSDPEDIPDEGEGGSGCPSGQIQIGTVNDEPVCGKSIEDAPRTVESEGGTTKTTQTSCTATSCTTTTTTKDSQGNTTGVQTSEQTRGEFCAKNPGSTLCSLTGEYKAPSSGSGGGVGGGELGGSLTGSGVNGGSGPAGVGEGSLYQAQYPDGLAGVWDDKKDAFNNTPIMGWLNSLVPNIGDGGCPQWSLPGGNLLGIQVGGEVSVPCSVWSFIKVCITITALFLARALVFGG